jgi:SAM-dependent methyltransferase
VAAADDHDVERFGHRSPNVVETLVVTDPSTDRRRLVDHAYRDSGPLLARGSIYRYQRDPVDIHGWVLGQLSWTDGARALDVGCGPGFYLARLREIAPSARHVGMDLSPGMAGEARAVADVVVGDAQHLPFDTRAFAVVVAAHMLYHVPDPSLAIGEFARVLGPGGHALVVLNGERHMRHVRELLLDALHDIVGSDATLPIRRSEQVTVESSAPLLEAAFTIDRCERIVRTVDVPSADPVVAYADSTQHFYAPFLPAGVTWAAVIARVADRVDATIARDGRWRTESDVGCFVCRVP